MAHGFKEEHCYVVGKLQRAIELCPFTQSLKKNVSLIRLKGHSCNNCPGMPSSLSCGC